MLNMLKSWIIGGARVLNNTKATKDTNKNLLTVSLIMFNGNNLQCFCAKTLDAFHDWNVSQLVCDFVQSPPWQTEMYLPHLILSALNSTLFCSGLSEIQQRTPKESKEVGVVKQLTCIWAPTPSSRECPWSSQSSEALPRCRPRWWLSLPWTPPHLLRDRESC